METMYKTYLESERMNMHVPIKSRVCRLSKVNIAY